MRWTRQQLDEEITWEQFQEDLEHYFAWCAKHKRSRMSWLSSLTRWASGNH